MATTAYPPNASVYPRVCGGTWVVIAIIALFCGLSPRVRGNQGMLTTRIGSRRSIPACAGEPAVNRMMPSAPRVYPRVCGGTCAAEVRPTLRRGLSPRVRGNREPAA